MKVLVATEKPFAKVAVDGIRKEIEAALSLIHISRQECAVGH